MNWQRMLAAATLVALGATACTVPDPAGAGATTTPPVVATATSAQPVPATNSPSPTTLSAVVMLQSVDVKIAFDDHPRAGYDGTLEPLIVRCEHHPALLTLSYLGTRDRSFESNVGRTVYQYVNQYADGDAIRRLAWYRPAVAACSSFDPGGGTRTLAITAQNLGGDESILVEEVSPAGRVQYVLMHVGDRFTEVVLSPADDSFIRVVAERAASRLRDG